MTDRAAAGSQIRGADLDDAPVVSIIVPVYNGGEDFARCLAALEALPPVPRWELIVADDGSTDGSNERARAATSLVVNSLRPHSGPAAARNSAAVIARGELLLFIDADVLVAPDLVAQVVAQFRAEPSLSALFGSYDDSPAAPNFLSQYKNLFHHYVHQVSRAEATTFWAGCGAIRRTVFLEFGGFDTGYGRPATEDIELGLRLIRAGHRIRLCHDLQVKHLKRWTALLLLRTDILDRGIPWTQLLLRERTFTADLNLQRSSRSSVVCLYLLLLALLVGAFHPAGLGAALLLGGVLLLGNARLYSFFLHRRGLLFALAAIPWHWLYYGYNGLSFVCGTVLYLRAPRAGLEQSDPDVGMIQETIERPESLRVSGG